MTKIPEIRFVYSYIYDSMLTSLLKEKHERSTLNFALSYIKRLTRAFDKFSGESLSEMSKISRLKWREDRIDVYVVKYAPYSLVRSERNHAL